jgi:excinuclease ABC subunit C
VISSGLREKLERLPDRPGVYLFRDGTGEILYVGKAKSLRNRVRTYFQASALHTPKTASMVEEVDDLELIVVDTEMEALILEANLIKRERPRYNIFLRDDKSFPYLKLSAGDIYPRVSLVRRARLDGNPHYGPFIPASVAHRTLKMIPRFFQVATCTEVFDGKRRPCLYYHLDQCLAPCAGKTTPEEYGRAVADARLFLEGRHRELERSLEARMSAAASAQQYEQAARFRDALGTVRKLAVRQRMASVGTEEQDYLAHSREGEAATLQLFQIRDGRVQGRREFVFEDLSFDAPAFYGAVVSQYYAEAPPPPEIYLPALPVEHETLERWLEARRGSRVRLKVPVRGGKRRFLELVQKNAALSFEARFRSAHTHGVEVLSALAETLGLDEPPYRIECFDISNIQGADAVAAMVAWEGGKPRKSDYRTYTIRGVEGPDDYASMAEAVTRRYRRLLAEDRRLPDLVLIDGGPGQRGSAVRALANVGLPTVPVVALAKRDEELWLDGTGDPIQLDRSSPVLHLVQRIRDEAHRFAVSHHRRKRARRTLRTELTEIPGVGPVTARKLLREFGSVQGVKKADLGALAKIVGPKLAAAVAARYENENGSRDGAADGRPS